MTQLRAIADDESFIRDVVAAARRQAQAIEINPLAHAREVSKLARQIGNLTSLLADEPSAAILARLADLEKKRAALVEQQAASAEHAGAKRALMAFGPDDARTLLRHAGIAAHEQGQRGEALNEDDTDALRVARQALRTLGLKVILAEAEAHTDKWPEFSLESRFEFLMPVFAQPARAAKQRKKAGVKLASPGGFEPPLPP